ncbi:substrate-binding periplasmic protein [Solidesulfovibrio alcoholivorans]|uniref:substrate-binding periplasmic protein n=1 Tax=Solidesulfovibrio alcoholivorans TaxID=81406 RepID=UPI000694B6E8|nr:transporter substrate-binding domain-containing protein [Solidesulfovibrio alcoholivorans]
MKNIALQMFCCLLLGIFHAVAQCAAEATPPDADAPACQELVYATNPHYPPYDWSIGEATYAGATIELLEMAAPEGVRLKPVVLPWKRALLLAGEGKIDLLASLRITPERSQYLRFTSHRAFPNPIVAFVRADRRFPYEKWDDLRDKTGGVSLGDTFGGGFDAYMRAQLHVEEAPSMEENFRKLDSGRIDYFVTSLYAGQAYQATHRFAHPVVALSPPISEQDIHFGFSLRSPCLPLLERLSARLEELDAQGVPERLLRKYLRHYAEHPPADHE